MARRHHKTLDLGSSWLTSTRKRLTPELAGDLASTKGRLGADLLAVPALLVRHCPGERDPDTFLQWLSDLSAGRIYEYLASRLPEGAPVPPNLAELRDRGSKILRQWNQCYFNDLEPAILDGLAAGARALSEVARFTPAPSLVEQATGGVHVQPHPDLEIISLVPQYHFRPINLYDRYGRLITYMYPVDAIPAKAGDPPPALLRATRALADESRLRILHHLALGPRTFTEVVARTKLAKSTVHHHLVVLRAAGLVRVHLSPETGDRYSLRSSAVDAIRNDLDGFLAAGNPEN